MILNQKTTIYTVFTTAIFFSITCEEDATFLGARFFTVRLPVATLLDFFLDLSYNSTNRRKTPTETFEIPGV